MFKAMICAIAGASAIVAAAFALLFLFQRPLIYPAPAQPPTGVPAGTTPVTLRTEDGLSLRAAHRPAAAGHPTIIFFHGNGDSLHGAGAATIRLGEQGYGLLLVEYRGYGGNPGEPSESGLYRDGRAAMAWLAARKIGRDDIVLVGNSLGSGTAVQMASEGRVAALILISGFTSLSEVVTHHYPWMPARLLLRDRYENRAKLSRISTSTLVIHGSADTLIPFSHGERLAAASPHATLLRVRDVGHDLAYLPVTQIEIGEWLRRLQMPAAPGILPR
ncbi:MAG: alpha/beta hydrolase [Sphingomonas sp.]